jgi:two-component system chemotaxis sensor kinase CheA
MSEMDDIVREFLVESHEGLDRLDRDLVALEQSPRDATLLSAIFRCIHTIKGTCGFLGFGKLEGVTHVGENLLSDLRDGKVHLSPEITSALLRLVDAVRQILGAIEASGEEGDVDYGELVALLERLQAGAAPAAPTPAAPVAPAPLTAPSPVAAPAAPPPAFHAAADAPTLAPIGVPAPRAAAAQAPAPAAETGSALSDSNIRVDVGLLDRLMTLVGELVLTRNQILQHTTGLDDSAFLATSQRLNVITTELQEGVMKTRMQPIGNIWSKFPRVVRDLALACGKQVRVEMEGRDTELDKTIIEAIKDPLTHIVRNSVDHGIETPEVRVARGKPAEGVLRLRAYHEGGQVNIEIVDDGGGINTERVKAKAIEKGVVTAEQAARMGDRELQALIFAPGFSTAEKVTNVSGRGVGMDVVKTNIERIGGTLDVQSAEGQGMTLRVKIPLTLAIIPALTVTGAGDRYCIPQVNLLELVRLEGDDTRQIERIHGAPVYRLRGQLLPLAHLGRELGAGEPEAAAEVINIVVLQAGERHFGLVVDAINDTEEIVVKPLGHQLKGVNLFAGATIMGDGRVALILDVLNLAQRARMLSDRTEAAAAARADETADRRDDLRTLLVFGVGTGRRMAIPLDQVARLEELPRDGVEWAGGREVVQYRGEILPIVRLSDVLGLDGRDDGTGPMQVVVYAYAGRQVGLVVDCIHDIVEEAIDLQRPVARPDLLGSAVIQRRVTDLLDVRTIVRTAYPDLFGDALDGAAA